MEDFFGPESGLMKTLNYIADIFLLSVCWLIFSLPIITMGAATTALYDAAVHTFRFKEGGTYARFFRTFKREFKLATLSWLLWAVIWATFYYALGMLSNLGGEENVLGMACLLLMLLPTGTLCWVFPVLSRFTFDFKNLNKAALALAGVNALSTVIIGAVTALSFYLCVVLWAPALFLPTLLMLFWSLFMERGFKKLGSN